MEGWRPAVEIDQPRIVEMARALRVELSTLRGGDLWGRKEADSEPLEPVVAAWADNPAVTVLLGTYDDLVVGYGVLEIEDLSDGGRLGLIKELFVDELSRAVGVGESLLEGLIEVAADQGCLGVDVLALPGHRETKNFFEGQNFQARSIVMHRSLTD